MTGDCGRAGSNEILSHVIEYLEALEIVNHLRKAAYSGSK